MLLQLAHKAALSDPVPMGLFAKRRAAAAWGSPPCEQAQLACHTATERQLILTLALIAPRTPAAGQRGKGRCRGVHGGCAAGIPRVCCREG